MLKFKSMRDLKSKSIKREFMWIEYGSRWSVDWDLKYVSIDDIEKKYKDVVNNMIEEDCKDIVDEFFELKKDEDRNIFSLIMSDDSEELFIEVNDKNKMLCKYFNEEEEGMYRIGEEVDSLFGRMSWSEIIDEYKIFKNI